MAGLVSGELGRAIQYLIDAGANVNPRESEGRTALALAKLRRREKFIPVPEALGAKSERLHTAGKSRIEP